MAACTYTSQFPILPPETEQDVVLDCHGLEDQMLRANALRDAILDEYGDVLAQDVAGSAWEVARDPLAGAAATAGRMIIRRKHYRDYRAAAAAAEARMIHVLKLRTARSCPEEVTRDSGRTEREILSTLEDADRRLEDGTMSVTEHRRERRELLDSLR